MRMTRTLYKICIGLVVALGLLHVSFTRFSQFTVGAMWFLGAGLAIVFAGFLNFVLLRDAGRDRVVQMLVIITDTLITAMFAVAIFILPEPQVYFGLGLFIATTALAFVSSRQTAASPRG